LPEYAHLCVLGIAEPGVGFDLQGPGFRGIECEGTATARFSFRPVRRSGLTPLPLRKRQIRRKKGRVRGGMSYVSVARVVDTGEAEAANLSFAEACANLSTALQNVGGAFGG
jgi:hypothetical protein